MAEGFSKSGKAAVSIIGAAVGCFVAGAVVAMQLVAGPAKASPAGYATSDQVKALAAQVEEMRSDLRGYLVRTTALELEQARQQGARDAALRR
jgi:hypothetical protein